MKRILIEDKNGQVRYLEGDQAATWDKLINGALTMDYVHGGGAQGIIPTLDWITGSSQEVYSKLIEKDPS